MTRMEIIGLFASYLYAFGILLTVEAIGRRFRWPHDVTRKVIHILAGLWVWAILYFFDERRYGLIPFATFIVLNHLFYRYRLFKMMDDEDATPGTIYFAISITLLFALFWWPQGPIDRAPIAVAGVMAMTIGDAAASLIGQRWGRRRYGVGDQYKSWIGSVAMFVGTLLAVALTLALLPASMLSPYSLPLPAGIVVGAALLAATVAALAEGLSPLGMDNLTVPLLSALALYLFLG